MHNPQAVGKKKRKKIDLTNRTVLIPGDVYTQQGIWHKGVVISRSRSRGWKVAFPPEEGTTQTLYEVWSQDKLMQYLVPDHLTAADIDSGNVIEPLDSVLPLQLYDHVYADFRHTDTYFYGDVAEVCGDADDRTYTVLFEDGDVETKMSRSRIVFLGRAAESNVSEELKQACAAAVKFKVTCENDDSDVEYIGSVIDLVGRREISDPERGEITGHTDTI